MAGTVEERNDGSLRWSFVPVEIDPANIPSDYTKYLLPSSKPEWVDKVVLCKTFGDGITNKLVGLYIEGEQDHMVLVRTNGNNTEVFIRRDLEIVTMLTLHQAGVASPLYAQFKNGLCYGYTPGRTFTLDDMQDLEMARRTAKCIAKLHSIPIPSQFPPQNRLYEFFEWIDIIEEFTDVRRAERFKEIFGSKDTLKIELEIIKIEIHKLNCPLVLSHNDTLSGNFIYDENKGTVTLIDLEYGGPNIRPYDIANHFCEFAGLDIDNIDYGRFPNEEFQKKWIKMYLEEISKLEGTGPESVTIEQVNEIYIQVGVCALAAHLMWTVWALLQAQYSTIDFDYIEYSGIRFSEYMSKKQRFLSL